MPDPAHYLRLSPYNEKNRKLLEDLYEDLAFHARFNGIIFHDDGLLTDNEGKIAPGKRSEEQYRREIIQKTRFNQESNLRLPLFLCFLLRYFRRKILPPAGVTSRYRPPPSSSLAFFPASVGLAFLIWRSFRGIGGGYVFGGILRYPQIYPCPPLYSIKQE